MVPPVPLRKRARRPHVLSRPAPLPQMSLTQLRQLPAVIAAEAHLVAANRFVEKARAFLAEKAENHRKAITAAEAEFLHHPTDGRLQHWLNQLAFAEAAAATATRIDTLIDKRLKDTLLNGGPKLVKDAAQEALNKLHEIEAEMRRTGTTSQTLQRIADKRRRLQGVVEKGAANPDWGISELLKITGEA
jgi:hypothetical protein